MQAFDSDYGDNAKVMYFFRNGNNLGAFNINARTGVIATTENITLLSHVTKLNLSVMARDSSLQHPRETAEPAIVTVSSTWTTFRKLFERHSASCSVWVRIDFKIFDKDNFALQNTSLNY